MQVCLLLLAAWFFPRVGSSALTDERLSHWAWQPIRDHGSPIQNLKTNPIDHFIQAKLKEQHLVPSRPADPRTLIRRLTFDLHGLPPTPEEVAALVQDQNPQAYEKLIDRLLSSPRYGERYARHWLDIAHYADTHGFERDQRRDNAWHYRDYVINALNTDQPYDRFLREQIAGDVIAPNDPQAIAATGFLAAGPWDFVGQVEAKSDVLRRSARALDLDDMVTQVMTAACGVTVNCARCHDHKIDPISQREYYSLWAVFAGLKRGDRNLDPTAKVYAIIAGQPPVIQILKRGDPESPAEESIPPGTLSLLRDLQPQLGTPATSEGDRRKALATWITDPRNPLTRRVIVNRLWHWHFGQGLVNTPSDFGLGGGQPSHPELLDYLADELLKNGWSLKRLHKLILMSATYRQSSAFNAKAAALDAQNRLLWRQNPRRIEAEATRDCVLAVSGKLNLQQLGGPGFTDFTYTEGYAPVYQHITADTPALWRRSIYRFVVRSTPHKFLTTLDCPDPANLTPARMTTTTALQSLALFNNDFILRQSRYLAERLQKEVGANIGTQIHRAYALAFSREPTSEEQQLATEFIQANDLFAFCRSLLNTNEFVYVD